MKWFLTWSGIALALLFLFIGIINIVFYTTTMRYVYTDINAAPTTKVVLVLGAALAPDGSPGAVFSDRIDTAVALYQSGKVTKILVSGDNGTVSHNEVQAAHRYLLAKAIPEQDIFLDHAGFDTYSSMYRARDIFGVSSVLIPTQSSHLPRAVFIARQLGMQAYGVLVDTSNMRFYNYVREVFAAEKAVGELLFQVKPKYLGDPIPIDGDGREYP